MLEEWSVLNVAQRRFQKTVIVKVYSATQSFGGRFPPKILLTFVSNVIVSFLTSTDRGTTRMMWSNCRSKCIWMVGDCEALKSNGYTLDHRDAMDLRGRTWNTWYSRVRGESRNHWPRWTPDFWWQQARQNLDLDSHESLERRHFRLEYRWPKCPDLWAAMMCHSMLAKLLVCER